MYECTNCGGELRYDIGHKKLRCTHCEQFFDPAEYEKDLEVKEQVLEANPDIIVTIAMYFGEGPTPEEEIAGREGWDQVAAVQNGAILNLQNDELSRPAVRLADGARMLFDFAWGAENEEETEDAAEAA